MVSSKLLEHGFECSRFVVLRVGYRECLGLPLPPRGRVRLLLYVDDMIIINHDATGISSLKIRL